MATNRHPTQKAPSKTGTTARFSPTESRGVALIQTLAAAAGLTWRSLSNTDLGIDGLIEDPNEVGGSVLVQVKTRGKKFNLQIASIPIKSKKVAARQNWQHWLSHNAPVVVILTNHVPWRGGHASTALVGVDIAEKSCQPCNSQLVWDPRAAKAQGTELRLNLRRSDAASRFGTFVRSALKRWKNHPGTLRLSQLLLDDARFQEALEVIEPLLKVNLDSAWLLHCKIHRRKGDFGALDWQKLENLCEGSSSVRVNALQECGYSKLIHLMQDWARDDTNDYSDRLNCAEKYLAKWSRLRPTQDCDVTNFRLYAAIARHAILPTRNSRRRMDALATVLTRQLRDHTPQEAADPGDVYFRARRTLWRRALLLNDVDTCRDFMRELWRPFQRKAARIKVRENVSAHSFIDTLLLRSRTLALTKGNGANREERRAARQAAQAKSQDLSLIASDLINGCYYYPELHFWMKALWNQRQGEPLRQKASAARGGRFCSAGLER